VKTALLWAMLSAGCGDKRSDHQLPDFSRSDPAGRPLSLYGFSDRRALVLISHGNECPILQQYAPTIRGLSEKYVAQGVQFALVNANPQDTPQTIQEDLAAFGVSLPTFVDTAQTMSKTVGFRSTNEAALVDPKTWTIVYRGAIDDQISFAGRLDAPRTHFLADALDQFLAGQPIAKPTTQAFGCAISYLDETD
jgi:thiol-disulfide isomerase/thioredoxin